MYKRIIFNNQIRAPKVRLIDEEGKQLGILPLAEAVARAKGANLDLIQVTEKVDPPICRITDYGKYAYQMGKKERKLRPQKSGEIKSIRLSFAISPHDIETRAIAAKNFLEKGCKVRLEMRLKGREKFLESFAKEKIQKFMEILKSQMPIKIERELRREPRGLIMILAKL